MTALMTALTLIREEAPHAPKPVRQDLSWTKSAALISDCGLYRYLLLREWETGEGTCVVIGLNPSTADEKLDDHTIRKIIGFAKREGFQRILMLNLFAFRATQPKEMLAAADPIGPNNDQYLKTICASGNIIVCAWGTDGGYQGRDRAVWEMLREAFPARLRCFGTTKDGHPKHPLYLPTSTPIISYPGPCPRDPGPKEPATH